MPSLQYRLPPHGPLHQVLSAAAVTERDGLQDFEVVNATPF